MRRNVLISSAGRWVGLLHIARAAAARFGGHVIATDISPNLSAACHLADEAYEIPSNASPDFTSQLHQLALDRDVCLIIPTLDTELPALSRVRDIWQEDGIFISVPSPDLVAACRDKRLTIDLFGELGIASPALISDDHTFPRFVKPLSGSLSKDIHLVEDRLGYDPRWADEAYYIQQEYVDPEIYHEYTVDLLYDRDGSLGKR